MAVHTEIGFTKRVVLVVVAFNACLLCTGIIFGFASLRAVLVASGVYQYLCQDNQCKEQDLRFSLMFTIGSSAINLVSLIVGWILDHYGPRITCFLGSALMTLSCVGFAVSSLTGVDLYIPSFVVMAIAGPHVFLSMLHISNAFPKHASTILSALSCAFDASSGVFFVFYLLNQNTQGRVGVSEWFLVYTAIPCFLLVFSLVLMPKTSLELADIVETDKSSTSDEESDPFFETGENCLKDIKDAGALAQVKTRYFVSLAVFMSLFMLRLNFYIGTVLSQLESISKERASGLFEIFGAMLPIGPLVAIIPSSFLLGRYPLWVVYIVLVFMQAVWGICTTIPIIELQYVSFAVFVLLRSMIYATANQYIVHYFGFKTFGQMYGSMMLVSGLFNTIQYLIAFLVQEAFSGSYLIMNAILVTVTTLLGLLFPLFIYRNQ